MHCTPSAQLETQFPDTTSEAAEEGTLAHAIVEAKLKAYIQDQRFIKTPEAFKQHPLYKPVMDDHTSEYVSYVLEQYAKAQEASPDALLLSETRVDFSEYVPQGFGTADTIIIADDCMWVIDFKYGKHVLVEAANNPQLMLYALGALARYEMLYDIQRVITCIVQPRMDGVSEAEYTVEDLRKWGAETVKPAAALAAAGKGEYIPGEHCIFCRAQAVCRAYEEEQMKLAAYDFADGDTLTWDEVADIMARADSFKRWLTKLTEYALNSALSGAIIPGFKLVCGRANRKITDEPEAAKRLLAQGWKPEAIYELKGLGSLEDMVGKKNLAELLDGLVIKPEGKPTLVPLSDKRPALNSAAQAAQDFDD